MTEISKVDTFERCDSCSARAQYEVSFSSGMLYFCGHHFKQNEKAFKYKLVSRD
ncbi:hypothetical protein UFOVP621_65 [uncultured Caudovirales phage]|uniref:DUF7455 domain-containing protein n=1 Tax=uncultured Caudovirales phage TaxID=2100421 RepID=A0A6J5N3J8_9CAUD|nr:hypothetical protein UFOVP621_65 [uncultured Caudovirales phage]